MVREGPTVGGDSQSAGRARTGALSIGGIPLAGHLGPEAALEWQRLILIQAWIVASDLVCGFKDFRLQPTTTRNAASDLVLGFKDFRLQPKQGWPGSFGECSSNAVDPQIESLSPPAHYKLLVLTSNVRSTSPSAVSLNVGTAAIGAAFVNLILIKLAIQGAATPESDLSDQLNLFSRGAEMLPKLRRTRIPESAGPRRNAIFLPGPRTICRRLPAAAGGNG